MTLGIFTQQLEIRHGIIHLTVNDRRTQNLTNNRTVGLHFLPHYPLKSSQSSATIMSPLSGFFECVLPGRGSPKRVVVFDCARRRSRLMKIDIKRLLAEG